MRSSAPRCGSGGVDCTSTASASGGTEASRRRGLDRPEVRPVAWHRRKHGGNIVEVRRHVLAPPTGSIHASREKPAPLRGLGRAGHREVAEHRNADVEFQTGIGKPKPSARRTRRAPESSPGTGNAHHPAAEDGFSTGSRGCTAPSPRIGKRGRSACPGEKGANPGFPKAG